MELRADKGFAAAAGWNQSPEPIGEDAPESGAKASRSVWAMAAAAALIAWIGFALWLSWPGVRALGGVELVQFVAAVLVPPVLAASIWLIVQRNSRVEDRRFNDVARAMRQEAVELERSVAALSRTVDLNRSRLAEQVEALLAMGDIANARLGGIARDIAVEIGNADASARGVADAAAVARASVEALLTELPRARGEVELLTRLMIEAGEAAAGNASTLNHQLSSLAANGRDAEAVASGAAQTLSDRAAEMDARSHTAGARLEAVSAQLADTVETLIARTAATVDGARHGIAAQGEAMVASVAAHQTRLDAAARDSADALAARIATIETIIERVSGRLDMQRASGDLIVDQLRTGIADVEASLVRLHHHGSERAQALAASIDALGGSADAMSESLKAGEAVATRSIGTAESLLIALDAATREIDETLPDALRRLDGRVAGTRRNLGETRPELLSLVAAAESTHDAVEAVAGVVAEQRRTLDQLSGRLVETLAAGRAGADALDQSVSAAVSRLESAGAEALRRAVSGTVEREVDALARATEVAVDTATQAGERVARETRSIADQTAVLETRLREARDERERQDEDHLSRRVAGLIEALNTAAINVAKLLGPEVSDNSWAAYLKGDRGVFTRRAVRLLDGEDARAIATLYDGDLSFQDAVNRYIHDFEAMLREVLRHAQGSQLSITLLSSDMGKLYVALAQGIERLR